IDDRLSSFRGAQVVLDVNLLRVAGRQPAAQLDVLLEELFEHPLVVQPAIDLVVKPTFEIPDAVLETGDQTLDGVSNEGRFARGHCGVLVAVLCGDSDQRSAPTFSGAGECCSSSSHRPHLPGPVSCRWRACAGRWRAR